MSTDGPAFFSRDELLGGLNARRASTILFAIEARTAHLVARSKRAMAYYLTERTAQEREREFLLAMAAGRTLPLVPRIQDLERHAPDWASLAPADPRLRAAIAELMGKKYVLPEDRVPHLRRALGLDDPATASAFESRYRRPIGSIYADRVPAAAKLRWLRARGAARIEALPPFWMAYALTLTETIGGGLLVLPIALAGVGPIPGVVLLLVLGLLNMLTIGGLVEAITRNGTMRYGNAYFGRLAGALLGRGGSSSITLTLLVLNVVTFLAYLLAFGAVVGAATGTSAMIWVGVLFAVNLFFLRRRDLDSTVATAIVIGAVNIGLLLAISALAVTHLSIHNLVAVHLPFVGTHPAGVAVVGLAFGVVLIAYFGHTSAGNVAKIVLERDPGGRSLLRGAMAATATVIVLYSIAVIAINGAVKAPVLVGYAGTAIKPLADVVGPSVNVVGAVYVTLAIGLGSIYISLGMFNQVREWLPATVAGAPSPARGFSGLAARLWQGSWPGMLPAILTFVLVEWLIAKGRASFAAPLGLVGTLTLPLLGGIFPMLLLAASRRRGEYVPKSVVRALAGPATIAGVAIVFFAAILVQGFVVWQRPGERVLAALAAGLMLVVIWLAWRRGSFRSQSVIEVRREPSGAGMLTVTVCGSPAATSIRVAENGSQREIRGSGSRLHRFDAVRWVSFQLPPSATRQLKVWVHAVTPEGDSEPIAATVSLEPGADGKRIRAGDSDGVVHLELLDPAPRVHVTLEGTGGG
jgi:amino acid permease